MYASFCRRQRRGEFDLVNRDELWGLLVRITLCKTRNTANRHRRKRRDIAREVACQAGHEPGALSFDLAGIKARGPGPCEAAALNEALEHRLAALHDSELRSLALKKLEGWTNAEIAASIGRTERCVERKLKLIRECWRNKMPGSRQPTDEPQSEGCGP
jgi:DNA-directed RNA polymerase specialized sigma24 family protein